MERMILYGASGHGKVIADILNLSGEKQIEFWDDNPDASVPGFTTSLRQNQTDHKVILSIGNNLVRKKIAETMAYSYGTAVHPKAILSENILIGHGTVVMAGSIINAGSCIGNHCIINTGSVIEHDTILEDYVHISPHATLTGNVSVREGAWIGAGATVIQGINIGCWSVIGAGTVVIKDVPDYAVVVGNPARIIRYSKSLA